MSALKFALVFSVAVILLFSFPVFGGLAISDENTAVSAIGRAEEALASAFEVVLGVEADGADVSSLLTRLNDAGEYLAEAHNWIRLENFDNATRFANLCYTVAQQTESVANEQKNEAYGAWITDLMARVIGSTVGVVAVVFACFFGWQIFKRRYHDRHSQNKKKQLQNDVGEFRIAFIVVSLVLILIACTPVLSLISIPTGKEEYSELWLLGPEHKAENHPYNVTVDETQGPIYVGVSNHMRGSKHYMVYVKLRNQTQPLPDLSNALPSPLSPIYEFQFLLSEGKTWETPLVFSLQGEPMSVSNISIGNAVFPVMCSSIWNSEKSGFFYQLFFELWLYNSSSESFQFNDRYVGIWLNMTST